MSKKIGHVLYFLILLTLITITVSSCDKRKKYVSNRYSDIRDAVIDYRSEDFKSAKKKFKALLDDDVITGDILYYYGYCLLLEENIPKAHYYFKKSIEWFDNYYSEFPTDNNADKAFFNLGILYYKYDKYRNLNKVKQIWLAGLARNKNNKYINEDLERLELQIKLIEFLDQLAIFSEKFKAITTLDELNELEKKYTPIIANADVSIFNGLQEYDRKKAAIRDVVYNFDSFIKRKRDILLSN